MEKTQTESGSGQKRTGGKQKRTRGRRKTDAGRRRRGSAAKQPVLESFRHAFDGLFTGLSERNMKIHCTMAVLVVVFGVLLRISVTEWCLCFVLFGLIMGLELVNTAVEAVVDLVTEEYHPLAKRAKDTAAGAVLIASIMAAVTGLIIFIPRLLYVLRALL